MQFCVLLATVLFLYAIWMPVLYFVFEKGDAPTYLDDDDLPLAYFGVPDGSTVIVNDKVE